MVWKRLQVKIIIFASLMQFLVCDDFLPIVIWHSAGESCCESEFNTYSKIIKSALGDDVYIKAVQVGSSKSTDRVRSMTMHPFNQIKLACEAIKNDEKLQNGFNAIGFSQGALFLRGLVQTCPGKMKNLISMGGPQQGYFQFPRCGELYGTRCAAIQIYLTRLAYRSSSQRRFTPATYWHDIIEENYIEGSTFLAIVNNEKVINLDYVKNLKSLRKLVLVKYRDDVGVVPIESTWFGYYDKDMKPQQLEELEIYKQDRLGLKAMKDSGKLLFLTAPLGHLRLDESWFNKSIIPLLKEK